MKYRLLAGRLWMRDGNRIDTDWDDLGEYCKIRHRGVQFAAHDRGYLRPVGQCDDGGVLAEFVAYSIDQLEAYFDSDMMIEP